MAVDDATRERADATGGRVGELCAAIEGQLAVLAGRRDAVEAACAELETCAVDHEVRDPETLSRLASAVAAARSDDAAAPVLELLGRIAPPERADDVFARLLDARSATVRQRAVDVVVARWPALASETLLAALAGALERDPRRDRRDVLERLAPLVEGRPELIEPRMPAPVRRFAARVLDRGGMPADHDTCRRLLGSEAHAKLAPYLDFSRASHLDVVALTPRTPPPCLPSVTRAEAELGRAELARLVAEFGWERVSTSLDVHRWVGLTVDGGFPLLMRVNEAHLFDGVSGVERVWERWLAVGVGESAADGSDDGTPPDREAVDRFRRSNLVHAEVLTDLMTMAPLDAGRARRLVTMVRGLADDFVALFSGVDDDAVRVPDAVRRVLAGIEPALVGLDDEDPVPAEVGHTVLAFEDPARLDDVRGLHGLKRFLHQRGLRAAFRRFRSASGAHRTVDLAVWEPGGPITVARRLRYVDLEPAGDDRPPTVIRLAVEAWSRHLLQGTTTLPDLEAFCYGNEVQAYLQYRNHPAFLRVDLAPPLRGGMLDLEYFAVSQYEIDRHPDLGLPAIREAFRAFDLDLEADGHHLHARYDKERAVDLGQLLERTAEVLCLVPYLMDLDWVVGGLDYPAPARAEVARAWATRLRGWGVLPVDRMLTADRRKVLVAIEPGSGAGREVPWDGRGAYRDLFTTARSDDVVDRLRSRVVDVGLAAVERWPEGGPWTPGQLAVERTILEPLREAERAGWLERRGHGLRRANGDRVHRVHEAVMLAERLADGGAPLERAVETARLVPQLEPHLRFRTTGSVAGHPAAEARLWLSGGPVGLYVLRDDNGAAAMAVACEGGLLVRRRNAPDEPWRIAGEVEPDELERRLRHDAYPVAAPGRGDPVHVAHRLRRPDSAPPGRHDPSERTVAGTAAAPGRAAGPVRMGTAGRTPDAVRGAVLMAAAVAPDDAPFLQQAAAVVSTGGGVLSHAGLVALELGRPSLVVDGAWRPNAAGGTTLVTHRDVYREEALVVGDLEVVCRRGQRVCEEEIREGDLVVVDADRGCLVLLGSDLDAVTVWTALADMAAVGAALATRDADDAALLEQRGRLLRAVHQLERVAGRTSSPGLVRFLVWELLVELPTTVGAAARPAVRRVLTTLRGSPSAGASATAALDWSLTEIHRRLERWFVTARELCARPRTPFEPLLGRAAVRRLAAAEAEAVALVGEGRSPPGEDLEALDEAIRDRLVAERSAAVTAAVAADDRVRLRSAVGRVELLDRVLGPAPDTDGRLGAARRRLQDADRAARRDRSDRRVLDARDLGRDAVDEVGGKAASLGELQRALGGDRVPDFFVIADRAFREVLSRPVGGGHDPLERQIQAVLEAARDDPGAASRAVRGLWERVDLPAELEEVVAARVEALSDRAGAPLGFAVRSSGLEEDTDLAAWAGQFDTFLGVVGTAEVLRCLRLAWAGLWTERAVSRRRPDGDRLPGGGVIVQRMVNSRVAGVVHTTALAGGRPDDMIVNVGLGLGEGVVSGTVDVDHVIVATPDPDHPRPLRFRYVVGDKRERVVADPHRPGATLRVPALAHQRLRPALEYRELETLVDAALRLEALWGEPLDLEFAFEGPDLKILQARPVPAVHANAWTSLAAWPLTGRTP